MKKIFAVLFFALTAALLPLTAAPVTFTASLDGPSEFPPNASPGTGSAIVTIDPVAHTMRVVASFEDLIGTTTAAHIHIGKPTGGVATTVPTFPDFPLGVTEGSYDRLFDMTLASSYNPAFLNNPVNQGMVDIAEDTLFAAIASGNAYLNIHTTTFGGGEIRGFLVPEPGTIGLVFGALAVLGVVRYKLQPAGTIRR